MVHHQWRGGHDCLKMLTFNPRLVNQDQKIFGLHTCLTLSMLVLRLIPPFFFIGWNCPISTLIINRSFTKIPNLDRSQCVCLTNFIWPSTSNLKCHMRFQKRKKEEKECWFTSTFSSKMSPRCHVPSSTCQLTRGFFLHKSHYMSNSKLCMSSKHAFYFFACYAIFACRMSKTCKIFVKNIHWWFGGGNEWFYPVKEGPTVKPSSPGVDMYQRPRFFFTLAYQTQFPNQRFRTYVALHMIKKFLAAQLLHKLSQIQQQLSANQGPRNHK